jgi:all-trans-retinol 13,14-reductase
MAIRHSTSALSKEEHKTQDKLYAEEHEYDYLIIGTGSAALTAGSLLANAGHKICMLEYHDIPGGYAQSFEAMDFHFCAQVHYIWGCAPGGKIYEFLKRIGLEKDITFNLMDREGYDHMVMPDGKRVKIPYGFEKLAKNIEEAYPGQLEPVSKFLDILSKIRKELKHLPPGKIHWWKLLPKVLKMLNVVKYRNATVQDLFDKCKLSKEAQAVLIANAGDFMAPPEKLSFFMYVALFGGYNTGAYYPTKHFKYYIERLVKFITDHDGCHVYYETEATKINVEGDEVVSVETKDGKVFKAKNYICNMDPQKAMEIIGREKFPKKYLEKLDYDYSPSGVMVYLGIKDLDLREHGFGSYNIWHLNQWDMNKMWKEQAEGNFENPWVFMSTPTLHTNEAGTTPDGMQILEIASYIEYQPFKTKKDQAYKDYMKFKFEISNRMIDLVEEKYIPNLRKHIAVQVVGTPVTNEDFCKATNGNAYGSNMTPENVGPSRLKADTPWKNFSWCNASSGWAGMYGTVATGSMLYMDLTGDRFYKDLDAPTDEEFISALPKSD